MGQDGHSWPGAENASTGAPRPKPGYSRAQRELWSFRLLKPVVPPSVKGEVWVQSPIDRFILARLEEHGLRPAPPADKATLIPRATLDLTGLPPTEEEVRAFLGDRSAELLRTSWTGCWLRLATASTGAGNSQRRRDSRRRASELRSGPLRDRNRPAATPGERAEQVLTEYQAILDGLGATVPQFRSEMDPPMLSDEALETPPMPQ